MTKIEQLLVELEKAGNEGATSRELVERVNVESGSLRTMLYELRNKRQWVRQAGGTRGNYRYALTSKGRAELYSRQPLLKGDASPFPKDKELTKGERDYDNALRLLDRMDDYTLLRQFIAFLVHESELDLSGATEVMSEDLQVEVLRFLGVDPHEINSTLTKLDEISTALRSTI